jgi:hypothetical protein
MDMYKKHKNLIILIILIVVNIVVPSILLYSMNELKENTYYTSYATRRDLQEGEFKPYKYTLETLDTLEAEVVYKREEKRIQQQLDNDIQRATNILQRYNSPFTEHADIIVKKAYECGGDESGFGRIPYKLYNPYGYLDGVQRSGWRESLEYLSCVISERFIKPCNRNIECIINRYGGTDTDKQRWIYNINWFISQI